MAIGRPKQFEREDALEKAMQLFWSQGYQATGVQDLVEHMGIGRQSLYSTFGDKRRLFVEAVAHYGRTVGESLVKTLDAPRPPLANIRKAFTIWLEMATSRGCLLGNAAIERCPHDPEVATGVRSLLGTTEKALRRALDRAVETGELEPETDTRALAAFLVAAGQGLIVMGKAGASRAKLRVMARVALSTLE